MSIIEEEKIKEILKLYNSYDDSKQIPFKKCNRLHEFMDTFKYNDTSSHPLPDNITRTNNGRLLLIEIPFIKTNTKNGLYKSINKDLAGSRGMFSIILNNGSKIMLKAASLDEIENELIIMYFLKMISIPCANYDIAYLYGEDFLMSNCFLSNNEILKKPFNFTSVVGFDIEKNLKVAKEKGFDLFYLKTFFADKIYGNLDRFSANFLEIEGKNSNRMAPLFDNAEVAFKRDNWYFPSVNNRHQPNEVIDYLLCNEAILNWVTTTLNNANLQKIAETLEKEKGFIVSSDTYQRFENFFKDSEQIVNEELRSKGKNPCIKLV